LFRQETEKNEQSRIISPVEGSDNGVDWESLDREIQGAFQIYRLFDPVFILPQSKLESDELDESDEDLGFPTSTSTKVTIMSMNSVFQTTLENYSTKTMIIKEG